MRRFQLVRSEDVSGCSGCGVVAEGAEFSDGTVVIRWLVEPCGTTLRDCMADVERIEGHQGRTVPRFLDPP
ncbi:hypothetical protein Dcar01_03545 [Deinococcus carri]|uniref:Uncharacterized protein n=1 Tax=Deinococcus carri TaxID=1211323 RepID=A0ABP9WBS6_9DEIO